MSDFSHDLIKGKIAEVVFEQMFRETNKYTVIPFGYEKIMPELAHHVKEAEHREMFANIRNAPDFAVISHGPEDVFLVEVKYRSSLDAEDIHKWAKIVYKNWKLAYLFYATPQRFYYGKCTDLMDEGSRINPLRYEMISEDLQKKFLKVLNNFMVK